jgi:predicted acyltransferase (DUF342 family)
MRQKPKIALILAGALALALAGPGHAASINKSISIADGVEADGQSSVNGSISIGAGATIRGSVDTVNGTIRIDDNARVRDAQTVNGSVRVGSGVTADDIGSVNGSIRVGENVTVNGEVSVVNGKISLGKGTSVANDVSNVNGEITVAGAEIGGDLTTVSGDVTLEDAATLRGNLIVEKPHGWGWNRGKRKPRIIIGPGSKVIGNIELAREVELFISESAEVGGVSGEMSVGDAVRFSGSRP